MTGGGLADLRTQRLILRRWRDADRDPFAALNADPAVMEHFPAVLSQAESDALVEQNEAHFDRHGFGLWAVEVEGGVPFVGFVGLGVVPFGSHFTPAVEIGWRWHGRTGGTATRRRPPPKRCGWRSRT